MIRSEKLIVSDVVMYRNQSVVTIPRPNKVIEVGNYVQLENGKQSKVEAIPLYNNPQSVPAGKIDIVLNEKLKKNDVLYY